MQAILKIKALIPCDNKMKMSFKDEDGDATKEHQHTYKDCKQKEILLISEKHLPLWGVQSILPQEKKWKKLCLCHFRAWAWSVKCIEVWNTKITNGIQNHVTGNLAVQIKKIEKASQICNKTYFGEDAIEDHQPAT